MAAIFTTSIWRRVGTRAACHALKRQPGHLQNFSYLSQCRSFSASSAAGGGNTASDAKSTLSHPSSVDDGKKSRGRIICITSGKGGVGKTTVSASFSMGLASKGFKTCVVDFDIGLRNLDMHLGMERRVIFDLVHVLLDECALHQALLKDRREPNLSLLAASQTRDKDVLTVEGVERILAQLAETFDYVILDSPAGIESGAKHAMYFCDDAIVVTNPELSALRDGDKMAGFIWSKSKRAELGPAECEPVNMSMLINRFDPVRAEAEESVSIKDMEELLGLPLVGVIPESREILPCTNLGKPVVAMATENVPAALAFEDMVARYLGEKRELRFIKPEAVSFLRKLFPSL